jgi:hypothetical protein
MLPPDGLRLRVGLYSPASNKTRAPRLKQTAVKKWIGPEWRSKEVIRTFRLVVGRKVMSTFGPQGITAVSRRASIRPSCPSSAYRLHLNSNTYTQLNRTELTQYTFDSR